LSTPSYSHPSVAVVGAAGFVGRELLRRLQTLDIRATAVVRGNPELSVDGDFHAVCTEPDNLKANFDIVVNLAYPADSPRYAQPEQNAAIARTVETLIRDGGKLIQVSTLAVFGAALDRPITVGPVPDVRDVVYVESKISAEHLFAKLQVERGLVLDVVRLGNVWGYASGTWALPIVQRLLTGTPVGITGAAGYSNATDVANVADYLASLIRSPDDGDRVRYHHLAEFSGVRWSEWIDPVADAMGVEPVYANPSVLETPTSGVRELMETLTPVSPRSVYRKLGNERIAGSWMRTLVRNLAAPARSRLKGTELIFAADPEPDRTEQAFLATVAGQKQFNSVTDPAWNPIITKQQSLDRVLTWLDKG
jgi:nucleoside-diphosphate-sugar epimerase